MRERVGVGHGRGKGASALGGGGSSGHPICAPQPIRITAEPDYRRAEIPPAQAACQIDRAAAGLKNVIVEPGAASANAAAADPPVTSRVVGRALRLECFECGFEQYRPNALNVDSVHTL